MTFLDIPSFLSNNKDSIIAGVISGAVIGLFSWIIHLISNTPPFIGISKKISFNSGSDDYYRIKIRNNNLSDLKIITVNFVISYSPNPQDQKSKNDIVIAPKKEDPLLFGLKSKHKINNNVRTFDTFVIDAQRCIEKETIEKKTSPRIQDIYNKGLDENNIEKLTIEDFFKEDEDAILSAVFYVQNHRTGITRNHCHVFRKNDIVKGKFKSGRSLEIEPLNDNPKGADV